MPLMPITHANWQVLRAAKRSRKPSSGKELRIQPTRGTKDGTFLNRLVAAGLLERVREDANPFAATYQLTNLGKYAAEYGEAEMSLEQYREM